MTLPTTEETLKIWAAEVMEKVEDHYSWSSQPLFFPRMMFSEISPYLTGVFLTEDVEFLDMTMVLFWERPL